MAGPKCVLGPVLVSTQAPTGSKGVSPVSAASSSSNSDTHAVEVSNELQCNIADLFDDAMKKLAAGQAPVLTDDTAATNPIYNSYFCQPADETPRVSTATRKRRTHADNPGETRKRSKTAAAVSDLSSMPAAIKKLDSMGKFALRTIVGNQVVLFSNDRAIADSTRVDGDKLYIFTSEVWSPVSTYSVCTAL